MVKRGYSKQLKHLGHFKGFLLFIIAAVAAGLLFGLYSSQSGRRLRSLSLPDAQNIPDTTPIPTATPQPEAESQISPDGSKLLIIEGIKNGDGTKTYTLTTSGPYGTNVQTVYSTTTAGHESMSIPFNTWSPDNKYFFVLKKTAEANEAVALRATGEPFKDGNQIIESTKHFNVKYPDYESTETTGWASNTLLIINTKTPNGEKGPSYWFEIPSKAIIPLSSKF